VFCTYGILHFQRLGLVDHVAGSDRTYPLPRLMCTVLNELYARYVQEYNLSVAEQNLQINASESSSSSSINVVWKKNVLTSGRDLYDLFIRNVNILQQPIKSDL
jgi:hypothetical protein